jgi:hypothetical protein
LIIIFFKVIGLFTRIALFVFEFLPVYHPNEEEKDSPELYAKNVQLVMANALGIEATDITYKNYYAEYCAMHNLGTPRHKKGNSSEQADDLKEDNDQLECVILDREHIEPDYINPKRNDTGNTDEEKKDR